MLIKTRMEIRSRRRVWQQTQPLQAEAWLRALKAGHGRLVFVPKFNGAPWGWRNWLFYWQAMTSFSLPAFRNDVSMRKLAPLVLGLPQPFPCVLRQKPGFHLADAVAYAWFDGNRSHGILSRTYEGFGNFASFGQVKLVEVLADFSLLWHYCFLDFPVVLVLYWLSPNVKDTLCLDNLRIIPAKVAFLPQHYQKCLLQISVLQEAACTRQGERWPWRQFMLRLSGINVEWVCQPVAKTFCA